MSVEIGAIAVGAAVGLAFGLASVLAVRRLPQRSEEALQQRGWVMSAGHPAVLAIAGALLGAICGASFGLEAELIPALALVGLLLPVTAIDLGWRIIPDVIVLPGAVLGIALGAAVDIGDVPELLAGAAIGFLFFLLLAVISPAGMGLGDVKLALMLGAFLGFAVVPAIVAALLLAFVPSLAIMFHYGREGGKVGIPFGPFLAAGGMIGLLWGGALIDAWMR